MLCGFVVVVIRCVFSYQIFRNSHSSGSLFITRSTDVQVPATTDSFQFKRLGSRAKINELIIFS